MRRIFVVFVFSCFFGLNLLAQEKFELKSEAYYKNLEKDFEEWLIDKNYEKFFRVTGSDTAGGFLTYYLGFNKTTDDSALVVWETVKRDFDSSHPYKFEEWLYKSMISLVKVHPKYANIQIFSTLENGERGGFYRAIYYEDKKIKVIERNGTAKKFEPSEMLSAVSRLRSLNPTQMSMQGTKFKLDLKDVSITKKTIYSKIVEYSKLKYKDKLPDFARDFYIDNSKTNVLYFEVRNLKGEVFSEEENNFVAEFVSWFSDETVDWRTVEELHFYIKYIPDKSYRSFSLEFDIKGRYGSGFHNTNEWEKMFDMEKDFDPKLERYQKQFANEIYEYLNK